MKNKLKVLSLLAAAMLLCGLTGCKSNETAETAVLQPVPENGWTMEKLMNATYLYDKQLQYPLTLKDLGEGFSIDDSEKVELKDKVTVQLKNGEQNVCTVIYYQDDVKESYENAEIVSMSFHELWTDEPERISVNGITLGSPLTDAEKNLGQPDPDKGISYHYKNSESGKILVSVGFSHSDENNQVTKINFFMRNGEQISDLSQEIN